MQSRHAISSPFYRKLNRRSILAWLRWPDTVVVEVAVAAVVEDGGVVVMVAVMVVSELKRSLSLENQLTNNQADIPDLTARR